MPYIQAYAAHCMLEVYSDLEKFSTDRLIIRVSTDTKWSFGLQSRIGNGNGSGWNQKRNNKFQFLLGLIRNWIPHLLLLKS